jgi:aryl-alcohol dehydrogenase-like predicted oxidoreductase
MKQLPAGMTRLGLGGYPLGGGYGRVDEAQAKETVDAALDAGITYIDTAESYLESEARLGRILKGRRDRVFLATKAFPCEPYSFRNLSAALESSLKRLQTDRIDLYQLHGPEDWLGPSSEPTPLESIAESLRSLQSSGKVGQVGVCNLTAPALEMFAEHLDLFSTQNLYSILDRGDEPDTLHLPVEGEIIPCTTRLGIAFIAYSPLSRGLLAEHQNPSRAFGTDDERHYLPRYQPGVYESYVALADRLHEWAQAHGRTLTQLAVAWTLSRPGVDATLIGAKSAEQVQALAGAADWTLTADELNEIDNLVFELPPHAKAAKMVVWDHFDEAVKAIQQRRWAELSETGAAT